MNIVGTWKDRLREFSLLHLTNHRVEPHDVEWFAWCKIKQTKHFPFLTFDIVKLVSGLMVYQFFVPTFALAMIAIAAASVVLSQYWLDRRMAAGTHRHVQNYHALRDIILLRAAVWSLIYAYVISVAPDPMLTFLVAGAMLILFIDGLCMVAMPKRSMLAVGMHSIAIALPLVVRGGLPNLLTAVMVFGAFIFLHYSLFRLHYMFATRRLRTRNLEDANDTIQLLLNQYDEDGSDWLFECDKEGAILRPNARFCKAARRTATEMDGMLLSLLFKESPERQELREIGVREDAFRGLVVPATIEGQDRWWSISARPTYSRDGELTGWRGFIADVTRTHEAEAQVNYMAHYDVLTNLPNRSLFNTTLSRAFARRDEDELLSVLYVDLDHFKAINDTHGHAQGDQVLAEAARRIEDALDTGTMVARLGGDEFAVLLNRISDRGEALRIAEAIVTAMDEPVELHGQKLPIGASVGVAFAPDNGLTGDDVLRAADLALYDAKSRGRRGASVFDPAMQEEVQDRRSLELDLRAALSRGELELHYQPLLSAPDTEIVGYEALLRWNHPVRGSVSPEIFIPIAEDSGQIVPIGSWVLREALREAADWPEHLFVSVNLSPGQMRDEQLTNTIVNALASSGVAPERLELEITETLLMQDNAENIALLHKFRSMGIQIALDDFGTGFSSLNYLRSFPFDKIKIDRCFVSDMDERSDCDAIIEAVVGLAGKLDMITTAEGVESLEQLAKLQNTGCTQVQGFLFSKARPAGELAHRIGENPVDQNGAPVVRIAKTPPEDATEEPERKAG